MNKDIHDIKEKVNQFIINVKLEEAVKYLLLEIESNEVINISGRLTYLRSEINKGVINFENASIERNKIRETILSLTDDLSLNKKNLVLKKLKLLSDAVSKSRLNRLIAYFAFFWLIGEN